MQPHPDFAEQGMPRGFTVDGFALNILGPTDLEEDFAIIQASEPILRGFFGQDWPLGLTREADQADLVWHARDFDLCRSFAWAIRDGEGRYLGCFYIWPLPGARGRADAHLWIGDVPGRSAIRDRLATALQAWMVSVLPAGYATTFAVR